MGIFINHCKGKGDFFGLAVVVQHIRQCVGMNRPKGLALTAISMVLCNIMIWFTIKPGRPPYSLRMFFGFTVVICIGCFFIWFYWKGKNWARLTVLLFSVSSILNLGTWNSISSSPALLTTPVHALQLSRAVLGAFLLYWLNTDPAVGFFHRGKKPTPPPGFGRV